MAGLICGAVDQSESRSESATPGLADSCIHKEGRTDKGDMPRGPRARRVRTLSLRRKHDQFVQPMQASPQCAHLPMYRLMYCYPGYNSTIQVVHGARPGVAGSEMTRWPPPCTSLSSPAKKLAALKQHRSNRNASSRSSPACSILGDDGTSTSDASVSEGLETSELFAPICGLSDMVTWKFVAASDGRALASAVDNARRVCFTGDHGVDSSPDERGFEEMVVAAVVALYEDTGEEDAVESSKASGSIAEIATGERFILSTDCRRGEAGKERAFRIIDGPASIQSARLFQFNPRSSSSSSSDSLSC